MWILFLTDWYRAVGRLPLIRSGWILSMCLSYNVVFIRLGPEGAVTVAKDG